MIVHKGNKWMVMDSEGEKVLGTHETEKDAKKQLAAIEISKHKKLKTFKEHLENNSWLACSLVHIIVMPNSKQRITARRHKKRKDRLARNRANSLMEAKVGTLRALDAIGQLPKSVKQKRLPNG